MKINVIFKIRLNVDLIYVDNLEMLCVCMVTRDSCSLFRGRSRRKIGDNKGYHATR